ncbi:MAG: metallophosphoesterase family protein [Planctomycetaceae bacterium]|nr:metallophosphoesterase family protein [Planctomycetaceae bacterium]
MRIAFFGGIYNNYLALEAAIQDVKNRGADAIFCLGDLGAFGPYPDRVFPLLHDNEIQCVQGNYDNSIGNELNDCQCGYTDPRDNHFAEISYAYTLEHTSSEHRKYLRGLPTEIRFDLGQRHLLLCHGSPRRTNEFLWASTTSTQFLEFLTDEYEADIILATHTGLKWHRKLANNRHFINVGVLGRPENDGNTNVWYTLVEQLPSSDELKVDFIPIEYDFRRLAREMKSERLPQEFIATVTSGWWTTCLEVLPSKERIVGQY